MFYNQNYAQEIVTECGKLDPFLDSDISWLPNLFLLLLGTVHDFQGIHKHKSTKWRVPENSSLHNILQPELHPINTN
jgi:hypothetical protein